MNTDIFLLSIETSTTNCSVSISKNGVNMALKEDNSAHYSHAENLHVFIKMLLAENNVTLNQLNGVVISKGPGSYTGLRIGVSTAKGLCYTLGIPLIAINTLESLAYRVQNTSDCYIIPMLDARRMEVYTAVFDQNHSTIQETNALVLNEESYLNLLNEKQCIFIGNGVAKFEELGIHQNAEYKTQQHPSAKELDHVGFQKFKRNEFENVAYFEPYYLKDFVAIKSSK